MEEWQCLYIKRNLPKLVDITLCTTELLTRLYSMDILSSEEYQEIDNTPNSKRKAAKLYEIVMTRKNAYTLLLTACKETKQTGVVSILEAGGLNSKLETVYECNVAQNQTKAADSPLNVISAKTSVTETSYDEIFKSPPSNDEAKFDIPADLLDKHNGHLFDFNSIASATNYNLSDSNGRPSLHLALAAGESLKFIEGLIAHETHLKIKHISKTGVVHSAVQGGNTEVITFLLWHELNINEKDVDGETPLHKVRFAKSQNYLEITNFLLDLGADLYAKNNNGDNLAHLFSQADNISLDDFKIWVKCMIDSGHGNVFAIRGQLSETPLQSAIKRLDIDLDTLQLILKSSKVDIKQTNDNGASLLHLALTSGRSLETVKNLILLGANINSKNNKGNGVLHCAVYGGNREVFQYLISRGLDVNEKNNNGNSPLHLLCPCNCKNYFELTTFLLGNGADLYAKNENSDTLANAIGLCKEMTCYDFNIWVRAIIGNGHAKLFTTRGQYGRTPLHTAMLRRDVDLETMKFIIESAKLDINLPDDNGAPILDLALSFGRRLETIKALISLGADWKRHGINDCTVMHSAVVGSKPEAFLYFKSLGGDVNATNRYGMTPLHYVRWTRSKDFLGMTKFLLNNGANLNARDHYGRTLYQSMLTDLSAEECRVWRDGLVQLGYTGFSQQDNCLVC